MNRYVNVDKINNVYKQMEDGGFSHLDLSKALFKIAVICDNEYEHIAGCKTGDWLCVSTSDLWSESWACNQCSAIMNVKTNFCPNCGADMRCENE